MKKVASLLLVAILFASILNAQIQPHKADLYLKITNFAETPLPFLKVCLKTTEGSEPQYAITDTKGNANFKVITGNNYQVYLADTMAYSIVNIPLKSMSYVTKKLAIPDETAEIMVTKTTIDTIDQTHAEFQRPDPGNIFFKVALFNHLNQAIKNMPVRIYNPKTKMVYLGKTNNYGFAQFNVPGKCTYTVGIDKFESYETTTVPHYSFVLSLTYIPTKVIETEQNDTILQEPNHYMRTTTDRALVKIHLKNHDNKALVNENVFFDVVGSDKVFVGKTGSDGVLTMLLPKGNQYELNFTYERAVKILDYPLTPTLYTTQFFMTYIGTERVENFYNTAQRENGFRTEFMDAKVTPTKLDSDLLEITEQGYHLNFSDDGPILTPAVSDDKLIISAGYYNPNIFCIDPNTGDFIWGLKLAENGASVMVIDDGMLLINTQSCTLYAIDLEKGILAWSKWLGPNIYHSPAVANGKVYAVYPDAIAYNTDNFVLAAFDLKTGDVQWQTRIKAEPLSAPVVADNQVFISDLAGFLYNFDAIKGTRNAIIHANAVSLPLFYNNRVWVNTKNKVEDQTSCLTCFNPSNLKIIKTFTEIIDSTYSGQLRQLPAAHLMAYSRSKLLADSKTFFQINNQGLQALNKDNLTPIWTIPFVNNLKSKPILTFANKYLILSYNNANINLINTNNGQILKTFKLTSPLSSEPAVYKGWIYCGTQTGQFIALNTKDASISGWNQFGMNAKHHTVKN
jgi:outer membrane protein assembly factor BamB